jgi:hypothetical protein
MEILPPGFEPQVLRAQIDLASGRTSIVNNLEAAFSIDGIQLLSAGSAINAVGVDELGTGTNDGSDFETLALDANQYTTFRLVGSDVLGPNGKWSLGELWQTGGAQDIGFRYHVAGSTWRTGIVEFGDFPDTGGGENADFNGDGQVDGADELILQRNYAATGQTDNSNGDANGDGTVNGADQAIWASQFGGPPPAAAAASAAVPEPGAALLLVLAAAGGFAVRRRFVA